MNILGIRYGHDAGAALIVAGKIIADVAEERFTRIKNDGSFPINSIDYCLKEGKIESIDLDIICLPAISFQPAIFVFFDFPERFNVVKVATPDKKKLRKVVNSTKSNLIISKYIEKKQVVNERPDAPTLPIYQKPYKLSNKCSVYLVEHHIAHAASACYTSGHNDGKALCVTLDGRGDGVSTAIWRYENRQITCLDKYDGTSSLGWFYGTATEAVGWRQSRDEWKMMGLAPFGKPVIGAVDGYYPVFEDGKLKNKHDFGQFGRWNDHGANHYHSNDSVELSKIVEKIGWDNFAAEVQRVSEEEALKLIIPWLKSENTSNLFCAGGFFLNVKFNQRIWYEEKLKKHWVYPNSGDNGLPVGAALMSYYMCNKDNEVYELDNLYKGPAFSNGEIKKILEDRGIKYKYYENIAEKTAELLNKNYVIGWFQGRMEAGPRALGNRSIIMSPLKEENRDLINKKIKYRETFRPFCPSILHEKKDEYLINPRDAAYMVISFKANDEAKKRIPAVVHVDNTARPQFVRKETNPLYYSMIEYFGKKTGEYAVLNTSLNVRGEPIICTPREAVKCFYDTGMDAMILGNYLLEKD